MSAVTEGRRLVDEAARCLDAVLRQVPFIEVVGIDQQAPEGRERGADLVLTLRTPEGTRRLVVQVKTKASPRDLRLMAQQLKTYVTGMPDAVAVIVAPYLSDRSRDICQELDVGCLDLAGNVRLAFDQVFIDRGGNPSPTPLRRPQRSLFAPRSTRVLRVLLEDPSRPWYVRDLASAARVSLGQTSNVKRLLTDQDLIAEQDRAFSLSKPGTLLREWAKTYSPEANETRLLYAMLSVSEVEERLAEECDRRGTRYGLALFSGANRVAPFTSYNRAYAFVEGRLDATADALGMKAVSSGANVALMTPYDEGVFYGLQEIGATRVVSDVQLYLDLKNTAGRGDEAAEFLYERRLVPRWNR